MQNQSLVSRETTTWRERRSGFGALRPFAARIAAALRPRRIIAVLLILIGGVLNPLAAPTVYAVDVPAPLSPADGAITTVSSDPPLGIPEFSWTAVAGATRYRLQVTQSIAGFSDATQTFDVTTSNTRYTPVSTYLSKLRDGDLYWHVRVESPTVGAYSATMHFIKQWASVDNAPILSAPADSAVLDFYDQPAFSWQPVTGAASYKFQIATSPGGFGSPTVNLTTLATAIQPTTKLANGAYYWRVIPVDASGHDGAASEVRSLAASYSPIPTLLEPANGANPTFTPTLRWTAVRGAQYYRLQYSTDPTFSAGVTQVDTRNTNYTPLDALPNDQNFYWRVRVQSGNSIGDWSGPRGFVKKWYVQPVLLTPANNYQYVKNPFFSWTPVAGASYYKIDFNKDAPSFPPTASSGWTDTTVNPFYAQPQTISGVKGNWAASSTWYWQVTPFDDAGNPGQSSGTGSFGYNPTALAPELIYPFYYYSPDSNLQPHEDRTAALPIFTWHRTMSYTAGYTGNEVAAYRLQVDDDPLFASPNWTVDTENLSAAPTTSNPFTPTAGGIYYWRVSPLTGVGGSLTNQWSQKWKTRMDTALGLTPTVGITLLRPAGGFESVETTPLLEWWPLQGADSYDVQISRDSTFASVDVSATVAYPAYIPTTHLGYGTYYWRVRGRSGGSPLGSYSAPWRFQVAAQTHWRTSRILGDSGNQLLIGSDPAGDMTNASYDLTNLYAAQSKDYWYFGFNASPSTSVTYTLYLDLDHVDSSGATSDARSYNVSTIPAHRPEYAIYFMYTGAFSADAVVLYHWNGSGWDIPQTLSDVGGSLTASANYVEIQVPNTAIGMGQTTGSATLSLFSALAGGGHAQDTVPSDPSVAYTTPDSGPAATTLSRFTSVSERITPSTPLTNIAGDPTLWPSVPPFFWHFPVDSTWYGYQFQVATDPQFTSVAWDYALYAANAAASPLIPPVHTYNDQDLLGDNTYYWRVRPIYNTTASQRGAWSQASRFERQGLAPQNLQAAVSFATPTFTWDMVEGARSYDLQVDGDPLFGSVDISINTAQNSYTPIISLNRGTYYWRVRVRRYGGSASSSSDIVNDWAPSQTFALTLPQPTGLTSYPPGVVNRAPTLCWTPLVASSGNEPLLAAWKYVVEVSKDNDTFSTLYNSNDSSVTTTGTEQACWTPTKGYDDGTYYWRVAMRDGSNNVGAPSAVAQFTKQYPASTLVSPTSGSTAAETPTFVWTPVNGAASYKLEVSTSPTFSPLYDSATTNSARYTPTKIYANQRFYWHVAMVDDYGNVGPYSDATIIVNPLPYAVYLPLIVK
jgi:hypothetical protein